MSADGRLSRPAERPGPEIREELTRLFTWEERHRRLAARLLIALGPTLREWAAHLARYHQRLLAVDRAIERVRHLDADAAAHRDRVVAAQLANCRRLAGWLDREGRLAAPWTVRSASDMLFGLVSSDMIEALTVDRGWSESRLARHLALMFDSTFVTGRA
jgi:hypothetical protein